MDAGVVTIVIPIYNVEKYLDRCITSIVNQTYSNLEIILVDDGSPDNCPAMCDAWKEKDERIKVIHKRNAGLGMARNTGIEYASGEYICFFDSDDYIAPDTIEKSIQLACQDKSDVVLFGMCSVSPEGKIIGKYAPYTEKTFYEGNEILDFILPNMIEGSSKKGKNYNLNMSACSCMFSMQMISAYDWRFVSERQYISEDFFSLLNLYQYVQTVSILKEACYFYCFNGSSLTHVYDPKRYERICTCYSAMTEMCETIGCSKRLKHSLATQFLGNVIGAMKLIVRATIEKEEKQNALQQIVFDETLQHAIKDVDVGREGFGRKLLIWSLRHQYVTLLYWVVKAKI